MPPCAVCDRSIGDSAEAVKWACLLVAETESSSVETACDLKRECRPAEELDRSTVDVALGRKWACRPLASEVKAIIDDAETSVIYLPDDSADWLSSMTDAAAG